MDSDDEEEKEKEEMSFQFVYKKINSKLPKFVKKFSSTYFKNM